MDWKLPYIVWVILEDHPRYPGIGIFNTSLCSFLGIPMECNHIFMPIAYSDTSGRWFGWMIGSGTYYLMLLLHHKCTRF